jgi:hypothetical protein
MSSNTLHRLTDKKGKQLSKFLGIDSVPSTQLIANMQSRINNPIFKLSIEDYEAMCENKMMTKMMSKVIGCEEKQLKKFCKYINVFADNIKSSPKSIKNKMKVTNSINASNRKGSLSVLPDDILEKIVEQYKTIFKIKYKLKDWIPPEKLDWENLSLNPNAIEMLKENPDKIEWGYLASNPNAIDLLKANLDKIEWGYLSENPSAIELLEEKINRENEMSKEYLETLHHFEKINWKLLSGNPNAIELLKENLDEIYWPLLSKNQHPYAIELLKENQDKINWKWLSQNTNPNAIELLKANRNKINWKRLSGNPSAIELLKDNLTKIDWGSLSKNTHPYAIELLKANRYKINWKRLSGNPNPEAIELLKDNLTKINWNRLSENPAIFDEILE